MASVRTAAFLVITACLFISVPVFASEDDISPVHVNFVSAGAVDVEWDFPYSDSLFSGDPSEFDRTLAQASLGLAVSSTRSSRIPYENQNMSVKKYLEDTGFSDLSFSQYDIEPRIDTVATAMGSKKVGDFTLVVLVTCGDGYGKEWGSNFTIGTGERHQGFDHAARIVEQRLTDYIRDNGINGKIRLWTAGFSRAAAINNLVAADMTESGMFDGIYAYFFACPLNTRRPVQYGNIFNLVGKNDPVASIPFKDWGFGRNGKTLYFAAEQYDSSWYECAKSVTKVTQAFIGDYYRNNPALDYKLRTVLELLYHIYPTQESYAMYLEPVATSVFRRTGSESLSEVILQAVRERAITNPKDADGVINAEDDEAIDLFLDYTAAGFAEYIKKDSRELDDGSWNPDAGPDTNLFHEHSPEVYVDWMFADVPDEKRYGPGDDYLRLEITGPVTVHVARETEECLFIGAGGELLYNAETEEDVTIPEPYAVRNGDSTILEIPLDSDYSLFVRAESQGKISCTAALFMLEQTAGKETWQFSLHAKKNQDYLIPLRLDEEGHLIPLFDDAEDMKVLGGSNAERRFALKLENRNIPVVSIRTIMRCVMIGAVSLVLLLLLSLLQLIYIRVKKLSPPLHARRVNQALMILVGAVIVGSALFYLLL